MPFFLSIAERFWTKVDKGGPNDCWLWRAQRKRGYGQFYLDSHRTTGAHRFAYELEVGPIPDGLTIDHLCRVKGCVNPAHLEPVTQRENVIRYYEWRKSR